MFESFVSWLVATIGQWGYTGITVLMFLESSFFPFPSEVVVPPGGYLASQGSMTLWLVIVCGTLGSLLGGIFNYWLALTVGRAFLLKYGRYVFISEKTLNRSEAFFTRHGHISTFIGRLIPGIRQYISLPAGLSRMHLGLFCLFTSLGAGIWVVILALLGYFFGRNQDLLMDKLHQIMFILLPACLVLIVVYIWWHWRQARANRLP
ncbi:MAG: DedA family protein [Desulfovermiculus sp.]|nr:DedA family protein [Desulfovermiculus sp.]